MEKQDLVKDIKEYVPHGGGYINISQLAKYLGCGRDAVRDKYVKRLILNSEFISFGRDKKFFIDDVAEQILNLRG